MEDTEIRDLVKQALEKSGFLAKIRAELRANVFFALEQNGCFKEEKYRNKKLDKFMETEGGLLAVGIIKEFLDYFNLSFTASVLDAEIQTGQDCSYFGRERLLNELHQKFDAENSEPVLCSLMKLARISSVNEQNMNEPQNEEIPNQDTGDNWIIDMDSSENLFSPSNPFSPLPVIKTNFEGSLNMPANSTADSSQSGDNSGDNETKFQPNEFQISKSLRKSGGVKNSSLSSLDDLPPLTVPASRADVNISPSAKHKQLSEKLRNILADTADMVLGDVSYASSISDDEKKKFQEQKLGRSKMISSPDGDEESISEIDEVLSVTNEDSSSVQKEET